MIELKSGKALFDALEELKEIDTEEALFYVNLIESEIKNKGYQQELI